MFSNLDTVEKIKILHQKAQEFHALLSSVTDENDKNVIGVLLLKAGLYSMRVNNIIGKIYGDYENDINRKVLKNYQEGNK